MSASQRILVTGSAGFIGHHLVLALQQQGYEVVGLDNLNSYYDPELKYKRLEQQGFSKEEVTPNSLLQSINHPNLYFTQLDISDATSLRILFKEQRFDAVVHLAAQAGVRHSIDHPEAYVTSNLVGFANVLECCRHASIKHLLFASSSSVYGHNKQTPFSTGHRTDAPISFYAATKKSNEVMAFSYAHLYGIPTTGLRFFTVYGPWGRPDMAYYSFAKAIMAGSPIRIFNQGDMLRDFTFVDDVVRSVVQLIEVQPKPEPVPYRLYNIGKNKPKQLLELVATLERLLKRKAILDLQPMQPGDVQVTCADVEELIRDIGYSPGTTLEQGLRHFVDWFKAYHQVQNMPQLEAQ